MNPFIIICIPGSTFSAAFVYCLLNLLDYFKKYNISYLVNIKEGSNINHLRAACLGCDIRRGKDQKPFNGQYKYSHILWIDSDIIFKPSDFADLYNRNKEVIAGLYLKHGIKQYTCIQHYDNDLLIKTGSYKYLTPNDIINKKDIINVEYTGFGFLLVKYGVFESIEYPYFMPELIEVEHIKDFCSEDISCCKKIKKAGYNIYVDPLVILKHLKPTLI